MHKKRGYKKEVPKRLVRDYKLFAIACEGSKTEPKYFNLFRHMSTRVAVDIIEEIVTDEEMSLKHTAKSSPRWVLDRAVKYIEKEGLSDEDSLWFVMDIDSWEENQLREIASFCEQKPNWHIVLSNPCFEIWLYFHKKKNLDASKSKSSQDFKKEIASLEKGGYHPFKFIPFVKNAIINSERADVNKNHFLPTFKTSKIYQLGLALFKIITQNQFETFVEKTLPDLIKMKSK
jgi:RloB-like protein